MEETLETGWKACKKRGKYLFLYYVFLLLTGGIVRPILLTAIGLMLLLSYERLIFKNYEIEEGPRKRLMLGAVLLLCFTIVACVNFAHISILSLILMVGLLLGGFAFSYKVRKDERLCFCVYLWTLYCATEAINSHGIIVLFLVYLIYCAKTTQIENKTIKSVDDFEKIAISIMGRGMSTSLQWFATTVSMILFVQNQGMWLTLEGASIILLPGYLLLLANMDLRLYCIKNKVEAMKNLAAQEEGSQNGGSVE